MNMMTTIGRGAVTFRWTRSGQSSERLLRSGFWRLKPPTFCGKLGFRSAIWGSISMSVCDEEDASQDISRIAFLSLFDGAWYAGIGLVNGEGVAVDLLWKRAFESLVEAELAFDCARVRHAILPSAGAARWRRFRFLFARCADPALG